MDGVHSLYYFIMDILSIHLYLHYLYKPIRKINTLLVFITFLYVCNFYMSMMIFLMSICIFYYNQEQERTDVISDDILNVELSS